MISRLFAGFYCGSEKLAENAAFNRRIGTIFVIVLMVLAPIAIFLIWNLKGRSTLAKVLTLLGIAVVLLLMLAGFWIYTFANTPHWC